MSLKDEMKQLILQDPDVILGDQDMIRALISADDQSQANNVIDLKSVVLGRMEQRLSELEGHQKTLLSAAYENVSTTNHVHRAVIELLGPKNFGEFLGFLEEELAQSLAVNVAKLCLEAPSHRTEEIASLSDEFGDGVVFLQPGEIDYYITLGRENKARHMTMRAVRRGVEKVHGKDAESIRSEALLKINTGQGNRPGLLVLASHYKNKFTPQMGTDLLVFYGSIFEIVVRRWLNNEG